MIARSRTRSLEALDAADAYDVCVVGSGPAGTVLSTALAEQGVRTLLVESGNSLIQWLLNKGIQGLAEYEVSGDADYPTTRTTSRLIGGNSNFWTGRCERFHPSDFETHPYTPTENPWPLRYEDLLSYYVRAEQLLRVRGGRLSSYAPPRREPFPVPPRPDIRRLKAFAAKAGITLDDSPTATPAHGIRFFRVQNEILPRFLRSRFGTLVSGVTAIHLSHTSEGRVKELRLKTLDGQTKAARARIFVVCCGGLQTPRLLLLSRSEHFPAGLGNSQDRVGRGFNEHPSLNVYGKLHHSRSTMSVQHSIGRTHQYYDTFRPEGLGGVHAVIIQSWVFPNHLLRYRFVDIPRHLSKIASRIIHPTIYMSPTLEMKPADDNRVTLSQTRLDPIGLPIAHLHLSFSDEDRRLIARARDLTRNSLQRLGAFDLEEIELTWSRHHLGCCRMGTNPKSSVVDPELRVHDSPNLYLCGSETFVTGAAVQPVLTITALALRLAQHLGADVLRPTVHIEDSRRSTLEPSDVSADIPSLGRPRAVNEPNER